METRFEMFTVLIAKTSRSIHKIKAEEMAEFNLKSSHVSCLYYLYKMEVLTSKELSVMCGEDKANISRSVRCLEKEGYIYCKDFSKKRYQADLYLTEKGKEIAKTIAEKIDRILNEASIGLTEENRRIFYQSLALICSNLEKVCEGYSD